MNTKVKNYVEVLFSDVPRSKKAMELKEEILSNLSEKYDDCINQGMTENQAYSQTISGLGDVDQMLNEVLPDADFVSAANYYRTRNAKTTGIAVSMYICAPIFLIVFGVIGEQVGKENLFGVAGLSILLMLIAVATGMIIYTNMSTPPEYKEYFDNFEERRIYSGKEGRTLKNILSVYWTFVTFVYLGISFLTFQWQITWIIWILAAVFSQIIKTLFEMRYGND